MRVVMVHKYVKNENFKPGCGKPVYLKSPDHQALFHQWGMDFEEMPDGNCSFSVAICELPDGSIELVPASLITFITPSEG